MNVVNSVQPSNEEDGRKNKQQYNQEDEQAADGDQQGRQGAPARMATVSGAPAETRGAHGAY